VCKFDWHLQGEISFWFDCIIQLSADWIKTSARPHKNHQHHLQHRPLTVSTPLSPPPWNPRNPLTNLEAPRPNTCQCLEGNAPRASLSLSVSVFVSVSVSESANVSVISGCLFVVFVFLQVANKSVEWKILARPNAKLHRHHGGQSTSNRIMLAEESHNWRQFIVIIKKISKRFSTI